MKMQFIKSGEWGIIQQQGVIRTDLGSCVAICLWDPIQKIGGLNHYLLPNHEVARVAITFIGAYSNEALIQDMIRVGASVGAIKAGIVGGGVLNELHDPFRVGFGNVAIAEESLKRYNIPVLFKRTGGSYSRSVQLDVADGNVRIREIAINSGVSHIEAYPLGVL